MGRLTIQLASTGSGDGQTDTIGGTLTNPLRVLVLRGQRPASGIAVSWTAQAGSISPASSQTDGAGLAQATWTLGDAVGAQTVTASLPSDTAANDTVPVHVSFSAVALSGAPATLVLRPGPSNAFVGRPLTPDVRVIVADRHGNVATDFHGSVTVALAADSSGGSLMGMTTVNAVAGVAAFADLSVDRVGVGYTLSASAVGLPTVTSATFEIVAPGAGRIAFVSYRDGNGEIYSMNADGTGQVNLTNNPGADYAAIWSPDGSKIAFVSERDGNSEIYVMNADGSGPRNLTNNPGNDYEPAWSPDSTRVAFVSERDGNSEIYVMNADGSGLRNLTNNPGSDYGPSWSPDGTKIAFASDRNGNPEIYVMNSDGSGPVNLTNNPGEDFAPVIWSPNGTRVVFYAYGERNGDGIYVMNDDGSSITLLATAAPLPNPSPIWSPDGSKIAYVLVVGCGLRCLHRYILLMNADGSGVTRLTTTGGDFSPNWSPDGKRIAFSSRRDGNTEIYTMNADGSGQINLTNNPGNDLMPAWRPR